MQETRPADKSPGEGNGLPANREGNARSRRAKGIGDILKIAHEAVSIPPCKAARYS
jgi:hypothetical protein